MNVLHTCAAVLRDPESFATDDARAALEEHGPTLLGIIVVSAAIFGIVVGTYRGGIQLAFAGAKLPLLWLLPLVVALPAMRALYRVGGIAVSYAQVGLATAVGVARATVLLAVASPALWLMYSVHVDYHVAVLALAGSLVAAGLLGAITIGAVLPGRGPAKTLVHACAVIAMGVVFAQSGWVLRPFIARPRADVAFMRPVESNVFDSVAASWRSARGRYTGWDARKEGLLADPQEVETAETARPR